MDYFLKLLVLLALVSVAQGNWNWLKTMFRINDKPSYIPHDATMEEWYDCHGMPCPEFSRVQKKVDAIKEYDAMLTGKQYLTEGAPLNDGTLDNCIWLTEGQADTILLKAKEDVLLAINRDRWQSEMDSKYGYRYERDADTYRHRQKRKIIDFTKFATKWDVLTPINYTFDGSHSEEEKLKVRNAFSHWMDNTCLTFQEVPTDPAPSGHYLLFTSASGAGCRSYVGKTMFSPQTINLQYNCFWEFGVPVHEIGHALGLWHEQNRFDRDTFVTIEEDNLSWFLASQYRSISDTVSLNVPYDYTSVMHYHPGDGAIDTSKPVIRAVDPLYQSAMGQRTGLSFYDAKIINEEYCKVRCEGTQTPSCQQSGYPDPKDCSRCRCPDGFSGNLCQKVAPPVNENCGAEIHLNPNESKNIESPAYSTRGYYRDHQECSWLFRTVPSYKISIQFVGDFGLYCVKENCLHWVEVKYKRDKGMYGPRFCCDQRPNVTLVSEDQELAVVFKANWTTNLQRGNRGFHAVVKSVKDSGLVPPPSPPPTPEPVPPPVDDDKQWMCSLELPRGDFTWCGMLQELTTDDFDWTIQRGPTPSDETGPDGAYNGNFYMFIEASDPRQAGDIAVIYLPTGARQGAYCLQFFYHMFGYHIRKLNVNKVNGGNSEEVWTREGQQGTEWIQGMLDLVIEPGDRIAFAAERGDEFSGDIAVDAISLNRGRC